MKFAEDVLRCDRSTIDAEPTEGVNLSGAEWRGLQADSTPEKLAKARAEGANTYDVYVVCQSLRQKDRVLLTVLIICAEDDFCATRLVLLPTFSAV